MFDRRLKFGLTTLIALSGLASYYVNVAFSVQGQGVLAQAPMNVQIQIPPSFVLSVDDSNSMAFETLLSVGDGGLVWDYCNQSFFKNSGVYVQNGDRCGTTSSSSYLHVFGHSQFNNAYSPATAIPPFDELGFSRSYVYNKTYFNPTIDYSPWKSAIATANTDRWPDADPKATRADPRNPAVYGSSFTAGYNAIYDLTKDRQDSNDQFTVIPGMQVPNLASEGLAVYYPYFGWSTQYYSNGGAVAFKYFPATYYLPADDAAPAGYKTSEAARPIVRNACGSGCHLRKYQIKPQNYTDTQSYNKAILNFANWFQYHRNRILSMVGSMSEALSSINNMRVGYFTINLLHDVTMFDMPGQRDKLYDQFFRLQAARLINGTGGTPNRVAVNFLANQFRRTDADAPVKNACQKNAGMLFTDGYTSVDRNNSVDVGNEDGALGSPYADNYPSTIADIAAKFYAGTGVPLRTGAGFDSGTVPVPDQCATLAQGSTDWKRLDCQTKLHLNFHGITLGANGNIYDVDKEATADPYSHPPSWNAWPNPIRVSNGTSVDEIWHATLNAHGEFINATSPDQVTTAMLRMLSAVGSGATPSGSISLIGSRVGEGSLTVVPEYASLNNGTDWFSRLKAQSPSLKNDQIIYTPLWEASSKIPSAAARTIYFGSLTGAKPFLASNVTFDDLCADTESGLSRCNGKDLTQLKVTLDDAVNYLRGDQSLESSKTTPLRSRTTRLGDIVNSTPAIVGPTDNFGYAAIVDAKTSQSDPYQYQNYLNNKPSKSLMVYVGANDGMLHAFDGKTGQETFAYIPQTAIGHMGNLLFPYQAADRNNQKFQHRYFVDGPIVTSDAYTGQTWKSILVGSAGAGGRGVFALDISTPMQFNANMRLWDINSKSTDAQIKNNIGFVLGKPVIVPVKNTNGVVRWKAIFGNGYGSDSGKAVLFVVDIFSGQATLLPASESGTGANGLGNIVVLDRWTDDKLATRGNDSFADTVYGVDQQGALWRFDLRAIPSPGGMGTQVFTPLTQPVFVAKDSAGNRQPILGGIDSSSAGSNAIFLYFGTGSFSFNNDAVDTSPQTFYGVIDNDTNRLLTRADLTAQTATAGSGNVRNVTSSSTASGGAGWYLDLPGKGERVIGNPQIANNNVFFTTYQPTNASSCSSGGANWLYGLNAMTGSGALANARVGGASGSSYQQDTGAVSLSGAGNAPVKDVVAMSTSRLIDGNSNSNNSRCQIIIKTPGGDDLYLDRACGRQSWRQVK